jgi:hypothetical protein
LFVFLKSWFLIQEPDQNLDACAHLFTGLLIDTWYLGRSNKNVNSQNPYDFMVFVCQTIRCPSLDFHIPHIPYSPGLRFVLPNMGIATCRVSLWRIFLGVTKNLFACRVFGLGPERQAVNGAGNGGALTYP